MVEKSNVDPAVQAAALAIRAFQEQEAFPAVFVIESGDDYTKAADILREVKRRAAVLKEEKAKLTKPLADARKAIDALFDEQETRLTTYEASLKRGVNVYLDEVARVRAAEEARLRDAQRELEASAEERAKKLRDKGKIEQADAVLAAVPTVPVVVVDTPKATGISQRGVWKFEVTDLMALVLAAALKETDLHYLTPNEVYIGSVVRNLKDNAVIPGVRVYEEKSVAVRA